MLPSPNSRFTWQTNLRLLPLEETSRHLARRLVWQRLGPRLRVPQLLELGFPIPTYLGLEVDRRPDLARLNPTSGLRPYQLCGRLGRSLAMNPVVDVTRDIL